MNKFLSTIIGLIGAYLTSVASHDAWNFIENLDPTETVQRIFIFIWLFALYYFFSWSILTSFDID